MNKARIEYCKKINKGKGKGWHVRPDELHNINSYTRWLERERSKLIKELKRVRKRMWDNA